MREKVVYNDIIFLKNNFDEYNGLKYVDLIKV